MFFQFLFADEESLLSTVTEWKEKGHDTNIFKLSTLPTVSSSYFVFFLLGNLFSFIIRSRDSTQDEKLLKYKNKKKKKKKTVNDEVYQQSKSWLSSFMKKKVKTWSAIHFFNWVFSLLHEPRHKKKRKEVNEPEHSLSYLLLSRHNFTKNFHLISMWNRMCCWSDNLKSIQAARREICGQKFNEKKVRFLMEVMHWVCALWGRRRWQTRNILKIFFNFLQTQ